MALGIRARIAVTMANPTDISVTVGNPGPASPLVQVRLNDSIVGEYSVLTTITLSFIKGLNKLELIVADGGLACLGKFISSLSPFASIYPNDPFSFISTATGSSAPVLSPLGPSGGPTGP